MKNYYIQINLTFIDVLLEKIAIKQRFDFLEVNTEGSGWDSGSRVSRQVELGVISITMETDMTKRKQIVDRLQIKEGPGEIPEGLQYNWKLIQQF